MTTWAFQGKLFHALGDKIGAGFFYFLNSIITPEYQSEICKSLQILINLFPFLPIMKIRKRKQVD
jgi:hypothetical protein